jgi:hypothetical protein
MKNMYRTVITLLLVMVVFISGSVRAGNNDRAGQAAAAHLLINPWASTNGWGSAGISFTKGIEAMYTNVAGMAFAVKTEIGYSNTMYNVGSQTMINAFGIAQALRNKAGDERGVLGLSAMIMSLGDIPRSTVDYPEGVGTFPATVTNIGASYALSFSKWIHAGVSFKLINETTSNATATGFAIDAGVQYVTGRNEQFRLGVVLKNIGLPMRYSGDGLSLRSYLNKNGFPSSILIPSEASEMPALLGLGISYDFLFGDKTGKAGNKDLDRENAKHRITIAGSYVANAYSRDQFVLGLEYGLLEIFQVRCGYTLENFVFEDELDESGKRVVKSDGTVSRKLIINTAGNLSGPSAGMSVMIPLSKNSESPSRIAFDYSYRFTKVWNGCHAIGVRIIL